jgi:predicted MFS family arabinose efflux permease
MHTPAGIALRGFLALALAMGIGRFAFTPILPMMQEDAGLSVAGGGWLASANYLGYLAGAIVAMKGGIAQRFAIRAGLLAIVLATVAMAFTHSFVAWIVLRALPGFASAWVLVFVSAWALDRLARAGRADLGGVVYAGVGAGIVFAGLVCLALAQAQLGSTDAWLALGIAAALMTAVLWRGTGSDAEIGAPDSTPTPPSSGNILEFWRLVFSPAAFGLGYIIPATFLPVMAKQIVADPLWFGWAWPVFGAAAIVSTLLAARLARVMTYRTILAAGNLVMAAGVLVPIVVPGLAGIIVSALLVGGTFMVNTMMSLQEARRLAGARARVLMAAMTSAFAGGQIAGPLLVSALLAREGGFAAALVAAALPLVLATMLLMQKKD